MRLAVEWLLELMSNTVTRADAARAVFSSAAETSEFDPAVLVEMARERLGER